MITWQQKPRSTDPNDPPFKEVEETISIQMRFKSGMLGSVLSSYGFNCNHFRLYGARAIMEGEPIQAYTGNRTWITRSRAAKEEVTYTPVNHFAAEMDHLAECIYQDREPLTPGEEGLRDIRYMMAAYESAANGGKTIKLA